MPDDYLTLQEVADLLKLSAQTFRRLAGRGELPAIKLGNQLRFRRVDIEAWVDTKVEGVLLRKPVSHAQEIALVEVSQAKDVPHLQDVLRGDLIGADCLVADSVFDPGLSRSLSLIEDPRLHQAPESADMGPIVPDRRRVDLSVRLYQSGAHVFFSESSKLQEAAGARGGIPKGHPPGPVGGPLAWGPSGVGRRQRLGPDGQRDGVGLGSASRSGQREP